MSISNAVKFLETIADNEENRAQVLQLAQSLDVGGLLQYGRDLGYEFDLNQFVYGYKLWYEAHVSKMIGEMSKEDVADLLTASGNNAVYASGPYTKPPYAAAEKPYAAAQSKSLGAKPY